jgi:hypothetical protein
MLQLALDFILRASRLTSTLSPPMTDDEVDELILSRLRARRQQTARNELSDATQSSADMAASFNEPEARVEARVLVLAGKGRIKESAASPGRWMLA